MRLPLIVVATMALAGCVLEPTGGADSTGETGEGETSGDETEGGEEPPLLESCLAIKQADAETSDGYYKIYPNGPDADPLIVFCDMTTDGGGWTEITVNMTCQGLGALEATEQLIEAAELTGFDAYCRVRSQDGAGGHTHWLNILFPPSFEEFYLSNYHIKANASLDPGEMSVISPGSFQQTQWGLAHSDPSIPNELGDVVEVGDVAFGGGNDLGPTTSFARVNASDVACATCVAEFGDNGTPYQLQSPNNIFRISWGEVGPGAEGWYPWWSGSIFLR